MTSSNSMCVVFLPWDCLFAIFAAFGFGRKVATRQDAIVHPADAARTGLSAQHRQHGAREIGGIFHEAVCAGGFELVAAAIAPEHTEAPHANSMGADRKSTRLNSSHQ